MKFDADIDLYDDYSPEAFNRRKFQKALEGEANFLRIKEDSKHPVSSFSVGRRNRLKNIPKDGNYGIIPDKRLFILDFDCHHEGYSPIEEQIDFFSDFLRVNLRESLAVVTQSGGIHVYLKFPENITEQDLMEVPKASLRVYSRAFSEISGIDVRLDADIRRGLVNGYVIGPDSSIPRKNALYPNYWMADETVGFKSDAWDVLTIPEASLMDLQDVVKWRVSAQQVNGASEIRHHVEIALEGVSGASAALPEAPTKEKPNSEILNKLRTTMAERKMTSFHSSRAFVKSALHCCYDNRAIAIACIELGIDKDSYNGKSIGFKHLMGDLRKIKPKERFHSKYCRQGKQNLEAFTKETADRNIYEDEFDPKLFAERIKMKIEKRAIYDPNKYINPRVLNIGLISSKLLKGKTIKVVPQQYLDAMSIVDYFLQPLSNVGVEKLLLARTAVETKLQISASRASQATRLLRDSGIIKIQDKQRTGLLPTYMVPEDFTDETLTKVLRVSWGNLNKGLPREESDSIYFNRFDGNFQKVFTKEVVEPSSTLVHVMKRVRSGLPDVVFREVGAGAAMSYLKSEAARYDLDIVSLGGELTDRNTGEILLEVA